MKPKFRFAALASATALTSAALLASAGIAQGCMFSKQNGAADLTAPTNPTTTLNSLTPDQLNKLGIAGAGLAAIGGLVWGGMVLKARLKRDAEPALLEAPDAELPPEATFEPSTFAIVVPPEALIPAVDEETEAELKR